MAWQKDFGGGTCIYQVFMKTGARTVSLGLKQYCAPPLPTHTMLESCTVCQREAFLRLPMWGAVERRCD